MRGIVLDDDVRADAVRSSSIVCRMKERSELSKLSIMSVADFASYPATYDESVSTEKAVESLAPEVKDAYLTFIKHSFGENKSEGVDHVPEVIINHVGPVIGSHAGPGVMAMFYVGKKR